MHKRSKLLYSFALVGVFLLSGILGKIASTHKNSPVINVAIKATKSMKVIKRQLVDYSLSMKVKQSIYLEQKNKIIANQKEKMSSLKAEVTQRIIYNSKIKEEKKIVRVKKIKKQISKNRKLSIKKKIKKVVKKIEITTKEDNQIKLDETNIHSGYSVNLIKISDLSFISRKVSEKLLALKKSETILKVADKPKESKTLAPVVTELRELDKLTYKFSANKKEAIAELAKQNVNGSIEPKVSQKTGPIEPNRHLAPVLQESVFETSENTSSKEAKDFDIVSYDYSLNKDVPKLAYTEKKLTTQNTLSMTSHKKLNSQKEMIENSFSWFKKKTKKVEKKEDSNDLVLTSTQAISAFEKEEDNSFINLKSFLFPLKYNEYERELNNFHIEFKDEGSYRDAIDGEIILKENLNNERLKRLIVLKSRGFVDTYSYLDFIKDETIQYNVPVFDEETYYKILAEKNMSEESSITIIKVGDQIDSISYLNDKGSDIQYLDSNFNNVNDLNKASFILMLNTRSGLKTIVTEFEGLVNYHDIFTNESSLFYLNLDNSNDLKNYNFALKQKNLLSTTFLSRSINENQIKSLHSNEEVSKKGVDLYEVQSQGRIQLQIEDNSRFELAFRNSGDQIIPSDKTRKHLEEEFDIKNNECVIQLYSKKQIKEASYSGRTIFLDTERTDDMKIDLQSIDSDGSIHGSIGPNTSSLVFIGSGRGIMNLGIEYQDGSFDYINPVCSSNYLVENL